MEFLQTCNKCPLVIIDELAWREFHYVTLQLTVTVNLTDVCLCVCCVQVQRGGSGLQRGAPERQTAASVLRTVHDRHH